MRVIDMWGFNEVYFGSNKMVQTMLGIKQRNFMNTRNMPFFLMLFLCGFFFGGCASLSDRRGCDDFQKEYTEYQAHARAGHAAINKKGYVQAIDHYTKAIAMSPFEPSHYYYRGLAWYRKGNEDRVMGNFDKVIMLDSGWRSAYVYRGLCRMKGGEYKEALKDYKRALNLKHDDASIHNNLAWLYATANDENFRDKAKALKHARKAVDLSKGRNAEILDTLAMAYYINGKVKEAVETERKTLQLEPHNDTIDKQLKVYEKALTNDKMTN